MIISLKYQKWSNVTFFIYRFHVLIWHIRYKQHALICNTPSRLFTATFVESWEGSAWVRCLLYLHCTTPASHARHRRQKHPGTETPPLWPPRGSALAAPRTAPPSVGPKWCHLRIPIESRGRDPCQSVGVCASVCLPGVCVWIVRGSVNIYSMLYTHPTVPGMSTLRVSWQ